MIRRQHRRLCGAVVRDDQFVAFGIELGGEALKQAREPVRPCVSGYYDREFQALARCRESATGLNSRQRGNKSLDLPMRESGGMADAQGSGPCGRKLVGVQVPPLAPIELAIRPGAVQYAQGGFSSSFGLASDSVLVTAPAACPAEI